MDVVVVVSAAVSVLAVVLVFLQLRSMKNSANPPVDQSPILAGLNSLHGAYQKLDQSVKEELARGRQEQSNQSQALRTEVTSVTDRKLELVRNSLENRFTAFTQESGTKMDGLTQSITLSVSTLQQGTTAALSELQNSMDTRLVAIRTDTEKKLEIVRGAMESRLSTFTHESSLKIEGLSQSITQSVHRLQETTGNSFKELKSSVDTRLAAIQVDNEKKLEQVRQTVDEKLQGTLEKRLGESFKVVSERLEQVHKGLGEMQSLASGVGDLKRVLVNVKTRGTWGEVQLGAILQQILSPEQYAENVATSGTGERVEYAIKLPGQGNNGESIWLPIDAKFPIEDYQRLVEASERADADAVESAARELELTLKACAKTMSSKYLAPPFTTDFGILFLSTEGLYAEAMRRRGLSELLQREHRIVLAGPSTLAALLNSLQMGFRTLQIQQRSSEVWEVLGEVKVEFGKYADVLAKIKKKLGEAQNTIERAETRTNVIRKKLRNVETSTKLLDGVTEDSDEDLELELAGALE